MLTNQEKQMTVEAIQEQIDALEHSYKVRHKTLLALKRALEAELPAKKEEVADA